MGSAVLSNEDWKAKFDNIDERLDAANKRADDFIYQKKEEPKPLPLPTAFLEEVTGAGQENNVQKLDEILVYTVQKAQEASKKPETRRKARILLEAGRHVLKERKKVMARRPPPAKPKRIAALTYGWDVARKQLTKSLARSTIARAESDEPSARDAGRAFGEATGQRQSDAVTPDPGNAGKRDPDGTSKRDRVTRSLEPPPPPSSPKGSSKSGNWLKDIVVGGVRIGFNPAALEAAARSSDLLVDFEERLLRARSSDDVGRALSRTDEQIAQAILAKTKVSSLANVTVVSLKTLCDAAEKYRDNWEALPASLRYPGPLKRIRGFVLTRNGEDLLIFGQGAKDLIDKDGKPIDKDKDDKPIDIDDLIVGLRSVWHEGRTPLCSLDPDPQLKKGFCKYLLLSD